MNIYEFKDSKGEVHSTSTTQPNVILEGIKVYLREQKCFRTVDNWNVIREEMKARFGRQAVGELDASGYITEWLKQKGEAK